MGHGNDYLSAVKGPTPWSEAGNDVYDVDNLGDIIIENADEGSDVVFVSVNGYALAANVEAGLITSATG